jgi:cystathionine beta-lyase
MGERRYRTATEAVRLGLHPDEHHGIINPPVYHASTVLFPTVADFEASYAKRFERGHVHYAIHGTPTTFALQDALAELEGGDRGLAVSSGLAAVTVALMAFTSAGDHILVSDAVYDPTRAFCDQVLSRFGVETTYYDPSIGREIAALMRPNTRVVFMESPGSLSFEIQDVPAIAAVARGAGAVAMLDNTWATPLFFRSFEHGIDVSVHAATKYIGGHSDIMLGMIVTTEERYRKVKETVSRIGHSASPDDVYLALRGLRTMPTRLQQHQESALRLARWLQARPEVARVLHPALEDDPGHALWRRDFLGACGLFGLVLNDVPRAAVAALLDGMELFGMGYSWGGFQSLMIPADPGRFRTVRRWEAEGPLLRIHVGLEDPLDLIEDLERGFERLTAASLG